MTIATEASLGQAVVVPCRTTLVDGAALLVEAEALWQAEQPGAPAGSIYASWGCVGVRFHDTPPPNDWIAAWAKRFRAKASLVAPVNRDGLIEIAWPATAANGTIDTDLILATATKADENQPRSEDIADAWINQNQGYERYFFENVRNGIRTAEDARIWCRIQERRPKWLSRDEYAKAIEILRSDSRSGI